MLQGSRLLLGQGGDLLLQLTTLNAKVGRDMRENLNPIEDSHLGFLHGVIIRKSKDGNKEEENPN
jgi:hypothetical protein